MNAAILEVRPAARPGSATLRGAASRLVCAWEPDTLPYSQG